MQITVDDEPAMPDHRDDQATADHTDRHQHNDDRSQEGKQMPTCQPIAQP